MAHLWTSFWKIGLLFLFQRLVTLDASKEQNNWTCATVRLTVEVGEKIIQRISTLLQPFNYLAVNALWSSNMGISTNMGLGDGLLQSMS